MAKQTSPIRMTDRKSVGKQNAKNKPRSKIDSNRQLRIQKALYEIADAASAISDMQSFYKRLHEIVGTLMYAKNFFIATYDEKSGLLSFPYDVDEIDPTPAPQPLSEFHGTTGWIIRTGYMGKRGWDQFNELSAGGVEMVGTPNEDGMIAPLKAEGKVIGAVAVQSYTKGIEYTDEDEQVLEFVAQHIAIALMRASAIEETRQRNSELAILNSVGEAMARTLDVKTVARIVGDKVRDIFSADQIGILLYEQQTNVIHLIYGYDKAHNRYVDDIQVKPIPLGKGLTSRVIESRQPLLLGTREEQDAHGHYLPDEIKGLIKPSESWLGVPIMVNEMVLGVVLVEDYRPHVYNENHLRLLQTLSSNMGVAIQNARLFDETQRLLKETGERNSELAIINSVQAGLASKLDMQAIYDLVGDKIRDIFDLQVVSIARYDHATETVHINYLVEKQKRMYGETAAFSGMTRHLIRTRKFVLINEDVDRRVVEFGIRPLLSTSFGKSALWMPLLVGDEVRGVITLHNMERENAFSESDVRLLETLANSMSVALENARLWEQEKLYRKALQRELEIGREIQIGFLPETLPQVEGWEIAASLMSAREVAGDFYDAFELPDGTIGLVIADVCDKGVGAALFMTLFRSLIRAASNLEYFEHTESVNTSHSTAERLKRAVQLTNNYIAETHGESGMFATLFFGILDPRDGRLTYINGGHEPPFVLHAHGKNETLQKTGPAVGAITDGHFDLSETALGVGDLFLAYTDGVPDCKNPQGDFYGRGRLLDIFSESKESAQGLVNFIETDLHNYIASTTQFDDITLLAIRRK